MPEWYQVTNECFGSQARASERLTVRPWRIWAPWASPRIQNVTSHIQHRRRIRSPSHSRSHILVLSLRRLHCYPRGVFPFFSLSLLSRTAYAPIGFARRSGGGHDQTLACHRSGLGWCSFSSHRGQVSYLRVRSRSTRGERSLHVGSLRTPT